MGKLLNHRIYIILIAVVLVLGITFLVRSCMYNREIRATVSPLDVEQGIPVLYADSTRGANKWLWEFGNGDTSPEQRGHYIFPGTGKYQVRLTVNGSLEKRFIVHVRSARKDGSLDLVRIIAPEEALQGEYITFRGEGSSRDWRWEFGETGQVDATEKTAIYKYGLPGRYTVNLRTEETRYPVLHTINIIPQYSESDTTDVASIIGNDIREKLQAIADQKPFNRNYNYVMDTYLCNNPNTPVIVNNDKKNDFYSYCQGLKITGRNRTKIENVLIDVEESESCINKLIVIQTDLE
jgi:hypothetical protein